MVREVKFKAQRCFEGQWEGQRGWVDVGMQHKGRRGPEISRHLQFPDMKGSLLPLKHCALPFDKDKRKHYGF